MHMYAFKHSCANDSYTTCKFATSRSRQFEDYPSCSHICAHSRRIHESSHRFARIRDGFADGFARIRDAFAGRFPKIPQDSPGFPRIPQGFTPIRGFAQIHKDSRGYTPIRESSQRIYADSRMDLRGFAKVRGWIYADSHKIHSD